MIKPTTFINQYVKHISIDTDSPNFKLLPFQEEMVNNFDNNKLNICVSSRRSGKSSVPLYYLLHRAIFNSNSTIGIFSFNLHASISLLKRFRQAYGNIDIDEIVLPKIVSVKNDYIDLSNGSRIIASPISPYVFAKYTFSDIFLDEFAFVPYRQAKDFVKHMIPRITEETRVIAVSTKNKGSYFDFLLRYGKRASNPIVVREYNWDCVLYRDFEWKDKIISMFGTEKFEKEYVV